MSESLSALSLTQTTSIDSMDGDNDRDSRQAAREHFSALLAAHSRGQTSGAAAALAQLLMARQALDIYDNFQSQGDDEEEEQEDANQIHWEDAAMEDDDEDENWYYSSRASGTRNRARPHKEPQEAGLDLLYSGEFGRVQPKIRARGKRRNTNLASIISSRLSSPHPALYKEDLTSNLVPNSNGVTVAQYDSNIYTAQYSNDSSFFYTCSQDFRLNLFDTTAPPQPAVKGHRDSVLSTMKLNRRIQGQHGSWTITDANLSPDNQRIVYSSLLSTAYLCSTTEDNPAQIPISFSERTLRRSAWDPWDRSSTRLYSVRFSADGNEIIACGTGQLFVYDLLANKRSVKIEAHNDDINSCCWADTASGNVLVSASDDSYLKVWDRRSLGASEKPSGVLVGHTEGITYVSAKGDGRYVLSNGKDQAMRLWDLRKMRGSDDFIDRPFGVSGYDYRYPNYSRPQYPAHPQDCSVMTYRGHAVFQTLIRCHFSPAETTGGQYLYSGSADGKIHIWSLDGTIVQVLDRKKTLPMAFDYTGPEYPHTSSEPGSCVRDASWHPQQPVLMSAAWEGRRSGSSLARHEWKGLSKLGGRLEDWNERTRLEEAEATTTRSGRHVRRMPGSLNDLLDDDMSEDEDGEYIP